MRLPDTPKSACELDLLIRLQQYSLGQSTWRPESHHGEEEKAECARLYGALVTFVDRVLGPLLNRVNSREMSGFTMHDSSHGLKVAHLMWHILDTSRQERLTPPEIAILVLSAHLHDLGMLLSDGQRKLRLDPSSSLWAKLDINGEYKRRLATLNKYLESGALNDPKNALILNQVTQAQEALLCADTRECHATMDRYQDLIAELRDLDTQERQAAPSINECLRFGQDSFEQVLLDICVSHNEDASALMEISSCNRSQSRFPRQFPIGSCTADLRLLAATLRMADVLDFDRERVPVVLYYYLLPRSGQPSENISVREWQKHLTISSWDFSPESVVFRGRSTNPYAHHAVLKFLADIEGEISRTKAVFPDGEWPYLLAKTITPEIYADGFKYVPYQFSLKEEKVFPLLMGRNLYPNPLDCIRELIQNSVDACQLRDALLIAHQPSVKPSIENRISITYKEQSGEDSVHQIIVEDAGTGMDLWVIENYLLRVGESYYSSSDFLRSAGILNSKGVLFDPVSEFGIGFVSVFMLADRVEIETAMPRSPRKDPNRRILSVDGVGRLIHMTEYENFGYECFEGTRITLYLRQREINDSNEEWNKLCNYVKSSCVNIPYPICLERIGSEGICIDQQLVHASPTAIPLSEEMEKAAHRIALHDEVVGIDGEIIIFEKGAVRNIVNAEIETGRLRAIDDQYIDYNGAHKSTLTRGGFSLGHIPGLPGYVGFVTAATGHLQVIGGKSIEYKLPRTNLARTELVHKQRVEARVIQSWIEWLLSNIDNVESAAFGALSQKREIADATNFAWLEKYSAYEVYRLARCLWKDCRGDVAEEEISAWERGDVARINIGIFEDYLHRQLFEIVLPRICTLQIGNEAKLYASPPCAGWKDVLLNCKDFMSKPIHWDGFAEYIGPLKSLLYFSYPGSNYLSKKWQGELDYLSRSDLAVLRVALGKIVDGRGHGYFPSVSTRELELLKQVTKIAPDALIGSIRGSYTLKSFIT